MLAEVVDREACARDLLTSSTTTTTRMCAPTTAPSRTSIQSALGGILNTVGAVS